MGRTPLFSRLMEVLRVSGSSLPSKEAIAERQEGLSRRNALKLGAAAVGAVASAHLVSACGGTPDIADERADTTRASLRAINADIGIVGGGIAGIACAYELQRTGVKATLHDANTRLGGRIWSLSGLFPGQVIERGGELIDTPHKTMQGYAKELGLQLEDITKPVRDTFYYFGGQRISEATMVDQYRVLVDAMRDDLRSSSGAPTADTFTAYDRTLDNMSLREYLDARGAAPEIKKLLDVAYTIEYGVESDKQSCLAFLLFAKASRQSKIRLWGNFSDERYHVLGGNQQIVDGLAARLTGPVNLGRRLVAMRKTAAGRVELTFLVGNKSVTATHDAVVLALPFHLLREVALDASLGFPAWKLDAIRKTVYGTNAKLMVGFTGRPWVEQGSSGAAYSDLPYLQTSWETNPSMADGTRGVITDYTGGLLGSSLSYSKVQSDADRFLTNFDTVYPGAKARARRDASGKYVVHLQHWPSDPLTKGSYTANAPGYFTTICGNEGKPVGNVYFAGETTDSFYSWQGFMEGGALSGVRAMKELLRDLG